MDQNRLKEFIFAANLSGYAGGKAKNWTKEADRSTTIKFEKGDWLYLDNFYGGEPYGGRTIVFFQNQPIWIMVYYGWVEPTINPKEVYPFLREALLQMPQDAPFRGPKKFVSHPYHYLNSWSGDVSRFFGQEKIIGPLQAVYQASYLGGLVDQQPAV